MKTATILGSGSWGTALACVLRKRGLDVTIWGRDQMITDEISNRHTNGRYLPSVDLDPAILATSDLESVAKSELILFVVPSKVTRAVAEQLRKCNVPADSCLLACSKGIEGGTGNRMSEILREIFPDNPVAVLSGPNHAEEVARELASAAVIGAEDEKVGLELQQVFTLPWFRTYTSDDVAGIEIGGAVKNVFAIAAGTAEGLGLGDNAKAALVTRGLAEMVRLGRAMGGQAETFQGLSGVGDLMVTCYSSHSRNQRVGVMLGKGKKLEAIIDSMNMIAEGVVNTTTIYECARRLGVETPLIDQAYAVIHEGKSPARALGELLSRDPKPEAEPS
jgi:glycerol-3-phosphate dehydrogenase (NAD(P)+)